MTVIDHCLYSDKIAEFSLFNFVHFKKQKCIEIKDRYLPFHKKLSICKLTQIHVKLHKYVGNSFFTRENFPFLTIPG